MGFDLELTGTHFEPKHVPPPGCEECWVAYAALHWIAEFILPRDVRPTQHNIDAFTGAYREPVDACEVTCLAEMEHKLAAHRATHE